MTKKDKKDKWNYNLCGCGRLKSKRAKRCMDCNAQFKRKNKCIICGKDIIVKGSRTRPTKRNHHNGKPCLTCSHSCSRTYCRVYSYVRQKIIYKIKTMNGIK